MAPAAVATPRSDIWWVFLLQGIAAILLSLKASRSGAVSLTPGA